MKPAGAGSVMADRVRGEVAGDDARQALFRQLEYFPTPPWAARAGGELILGLDPGAWVCWEPACGEGHMAHGLSEAFAAVHASDIHLHGGALQRAPALDFLDPAADAVDQADWIVTNPPFARAAEFVEAGLRRARRGVAILARLSFFESAYRYRLFFGERHLTVFAPFFERVPMTLGAWDPKASTATAYAWFVWMQPSAIWEAHAATGRPLGGESPIVIPIRPGTKARLTRSDDARDWGARRPMALFDAPSPENAPAEAAIHETTGEDHG